MNASRFYPCSGWLLLLALSLGWASCLRAQPLIYQATGTREEVQPVIDQFKRDMVYGPNGSPENLPEFPGSSQVAGFDDTTVGSANTVMQGRDPIVSGGLNFVGGPGTPIMLSAGTLEGNEANRSFGDLDPGFPQMVQAYSPPSTLALQPLGSTPGTGFLIGWKPGPAGSTQLLPFNAFGAVFNGLNSGDAARLVTGTFETGPLEVTPPVGGPFSFIGVIHQDARFGSVSVYFPLLRLQSGSAVTMDDFIIGTAYPMPEPRVGVLLALAGGSVLTGLAGRALRRVKQPPSIPGW